MIFIKISLTLYEYCYTPIHHHHDQWSWKSGWLHAQSNGCSVENVKITVYWNRWPKFSKGTTLMQCVSIETFFHDFLYWSLLAGAVFDSLPGGRHWGNCLPGQPFQIIYMSSTLNLAIFSFSISALHCGHEVGGGGDQESPIHKSEQVVTLGGKQVLNSILITTIKWPGRQFICHRKDSNVGDWLRASTRKRKGWRKTWTFFYKKIQRKQSRNEGEHNIRKKTDLSSSWSSGVLRVATLNTSYFLTQAYFLKCIY